MGVIEVPRGTLIHHYRVNEEDQMACANLIVSTTHNNPAINESIRNVARNLTDPKCPEANWTFGSTKLQLGFLWRISRV
jgi:coenzyme F420-reducing hydrogenase alpha subunit